MNYKAYTLALLLCSFAAVPGAAQVNTHAQNTTGTIAAFPVQAKPDTPAQPVPPIFLLRVVLNAQQAQQTSTAPSTAQSNKLDPAELIAAEEELSLLRNSDIYATFEKYPYLLDPAYRRADADTRQQMRQRFEQERQQAKDPPAAQSSSRSTHGGSVWRRKVGL